MLSSILYVIAHNRREPACRKTNDVMQRAFVAPQLARCDCASCGATNARCITSFVFLQAGSRRLCAITYRMLDNIRILCRPASGFVVCHFYLLEKIYMENQLNTQALRSVQLDKLKELQAQQKN